MLHSTLETWTGDSPLDQIPRRIFRALRRYGIHILCFGGVYCLVLFVPYGLMSRVIQDGSNSSLQIILPKSCYEDLNSELESINEIEKVGSAAATTIITLLPALLTFSSIPTAKISSLLAFSTGAALLTSGLKFGLPIPNISTLAKDRVIKVKDLCEEATIQFFGQF